MRMRWLMTVSRWRAARPVVVLVAAMAAVLSAWFVHAWPMGGHATASPRDHAAATEKGRGGVVVRWVVSPR